MNLDLSRKRGVVVDIVTNVKRSKIQISRLDASLEAKLKRMSGKVYEVYSKPVFDGELQRKRKMHLFQLNSIFIGRRRV